ncbi:MAG TPA: enoyl-CoA hydratase/isomerase family protein [Phycisphaerales bacterium]|nr:enoyl-CoA hydratase/isomerase family protein [Phycisphaerales bacterium]
MINSESQIVQISQDGAVTRITLNDPQKRNALSLAMFDALDAALAEASQDDSCSVIVLRGNGPAFCAGFDLPAAIVDESLLAILILRLASLLKAIRRAPQVTVATVHGAAIAGGCAIVSACDFAIAHPNAKLGYPVHPIGLSPAVTIPTLETKIGPGAARALTSSGEILDASAARQIGLITHVATSADGYESECAAFVQAFAGKPPYALRVTKNWMNQLDGSLDDARYDRPAEDSAAATQSQEARDLLRAFWKARTAAR